MSSNLTTYSDSTGDFPDMYRKYQMMVNGSPYSTAVFNQMYPPLTVPWNVGPEEKRKPSRRNPVRNSLLLLLCN